MIQPHIAQAHSHASVSGLLRSNSAKRFLELPPSKQKATGKLVAWLVGTGSGTTSSVSPRSCKCILPFI